jgi:hypothetical protein
VSPVRLPRRLLVLAVPVVLLAAPACSEPDRPSQEQYASMADGVCKATDEKLTELYEAYEVAKYEAAASGESTTYVDRPDRWVRAKVIPEYERMANGLRGIPPPDGDDAYVADIYADLDKRIEVLHNHPGDGRAVIDDDPGLRTRFEGYGIEQCPAPPPDEDDIILPSVPVTTTAPG